jgi:hypothetical protein
MGIALVVVGVVLLIATWGSKRRKLRRNARQRVDPVKAALYSPKEFRRHRTPRQ